MDSRVAISAAASSVADWDSSVATFASSEETAAARSLTRRETTRARASDDESQTRRDARVDAVRRRRDRRWRRRNRRIPCRERPRLRRRNRHPRVDGAGWWRSTRRRRVRRFARTPRRSRASSRDRRGANRRRVRRRGWTTAGWTARRPSSIVARRFESRPVPRRTRRRVRVLEMEGFVHLRVLRPQHLRAYLLDRRAESLRVVVVLSRTTTRTNSRRARVRLARRREPRRDWFSARRRVWRRRRPLGSRDDVHGVLAAGVRRLGVGAARADEPRHHGPCSCLAATCNGVSPRASLARADARVLVGVLEDEANGREGFRAPPPRASAESAAEASSAGGHRARASTNTATIAAAVPKREFYSRASERSADDPRASPPIARAARRVRRRAIARRLVFARDDDADERTDQAPRDTQRRNPYPSTLRREIRAGTIPLFEVGRPAGSMKCSRRPTVATSS